MNSTISKSLWQAEMLRFTAFPATPAVDKGAKWWERLCNQEPPSRIAGDDRIIESGILIEDKCMLTIDQQPGRVDFLLLPFRTSEKAKLFQSIDSIDNATKLLSDVVSRWLVMAPTLVRLAYGGTFSQLSPSRVDGYKAISAYLPALAVDPEHSTELSYSINRPRDSKTGIAGLVINRISKWSVVKGVELPSESPGQPEKVLPSSAYASRVEIDVNTALEFPNPFERKELPLIAEELFTLGIELATLGDRP